MRSRASECMLHQAPYRGLERLYHSRLSAGTRFTEEERCSRSRSGTGGAERQVFPQAQDSCLTLLLITLPPDRIPQGAQSRSALLLKSRTYTELRVRTSSRRHTHARTQIHITETHRQIGLSPSPTPSPHGDSLHAFPHHQTADTQGDFCIRRNSM